MTFTETTLAKTLYGSDASEPVVMRIRIIEALGVSELTVEQLAECLDSDAVLIRSHLSAMALDGQVTNRPVGQQVFWRKV